MCEIASRQLPFEDVRDNSLISGLVKEGERPDIPPDCPVTFSKLIQQCWNADPNARPECEQILDEMAKHGHEFGDQTPQVAPEMSKSANSPSSSLSSSGSNPPSSGTRSLPPPPPPRRAEDTRPKLKVLFNFNATESDQLTIQQGEIVRLIAKDASGWWEGELNGKKGLFPGE